MADGIIRRLCPNPRVILDCGAYVGIISEILRDAYPQAQIYAFEPVKAAFDKLSDRSVPLRIHPVQAAVCNSNGFADINLTESPESCSLLGYLEHDNPLAKWHRVIGHERVLTVRLDDWCASEGIATTAVDIIKMDVQGAELEALKGATQILRTVTSLILEVAFVPFYDQCPLVADIDEYLNGFGFKRLCTLPGSDPLIWADAVYARKNHGTTRTTENSDSHFNQPWVVAR